MKPGLIGAAFAELLFAPPHVAHKLDSYKTVHKLGVFCSFESKCIVRYLAQILLLLLEVHILVNCTMQIPCLKPPTAIKLAIENATPRLPCLVMPRHARCPTTIALALASAQHCHFITHLLDLPRQPLSHGE